MRFIPIVDRSLTVLLDHAPGPASDDIYIGDALDHEEVVGGMAPYGTVRGAFSEWRVVLVEIFAIGGSIPPLVNESGAFSSGHRVENTGRGR